MFKFFSINKNQVGVLSTLLALVFLGAGYFFIYLPNNEKTVQERRFLCLQNIDNNIHSKIENSISMLDNLLMPYPKINARDKKDGITGFVNNLNSYIGKYSKSNFTLLPVELSPKNKKNRKELTVPPDDSTVTAKIVTDPSAQQFTLYASKALRNTGLTDSLTMGIRFGFAQFVKPLLPADVFDHYIVFNSKADNKSSGNRVVFETFPSGLSYQIKDSLLTVKNGMVGPGVRSLNIGGKDYKIFSQPVSFDGDNEWIVVGLVSNKNYQKEKNQLPVWAVLLLFTAAIGMIISLPWIKLYHMGNKDKLTITDGISSVLVSMLLMSLLFFVFYKYNLYLSDSSSSNSRDRLANTISAAFTDELDKAYNTLTEFDAEYRKSRRNTPFHIARNNQMKPQTAANTLVSDDIINLGKDSIVLNKPAYEPGAGKTPLTYQSEKNKLNSFARKMDVDQVFWLDKDGKEIHNWNTGNAYIPHSDLSSREYFKKIMSGKYYTLNGHEFFLEQVVSRTSGTFTSVISKRASAGRAAVAAMSFTAKSLDHVLLPDGYQFAIIDHSGQVLYHSLKDRNLNENLKTELADSSELISCIEAKSDTSFKEEYYGKEYYVKIKALTALPYHIVIFEDLEYNDTRDTEAYAFTVSMLLCLLTFLVVQFGVAFFVSSKRSFFKKQLFETSWVGPKKVFHEHYTLATIINLTVIVLLIYNFDLSSFLKYLYLILFSITLIAIFSNGLFAIYYKKHNPYNVRFKVVAIGWLIIFAIAIDAVAWRTLEPGNRQALLINEGLLTVISIGVIYLCYFIKSSWPETLNKIKKFKNSPNFPWTYTHSFALMATTRLIITSGIPVAFFFIYSFNYEQNLDTRYKQFRFAKELNQKITAAKIKPADLSKYLGETAGVYVDGTFIQTKLPSNRAVLLKYSKEDSLTVGLLNAFRLYKNNVAIKSSNMNFASVDDKAYFNSLTHEQTTSSNTTQTYYKTVGDHYIWLSSAKNIYHLSHKWLLVPLLIALVVAFYYVIHNIIRKLFALSLPSQSGWREMDKQILLDDKLNSLLLIVGPPGSGKLSKLKKKLKKMKGHNGHSLIYDEKDHTLDNVFIADMIRIPAENGEGDDWKKCREDTLKKSNSLVIINHFEYNIKDAATNSKKLDLLELLMLQGVSKIIIISTVHPLTFLDSFDEEQKTGIAKQQQASDQPGTPPVNGIAVSELERWHVLLGHFRIIIESLEENRELGADILTESIMEETRYTHYLHNMRGQAIDAISQLEDVGMGLSTDSLIFKMQINAHYFYTYIWQSLTKEEKFLLYDLAEDGLVNPYDDYNLSMLISKGLITTERGTLMLFNKGFRNYILTAIGNTEVERIKAQVKDNGNWASLRGPLNLAILAILIFLIASQQEAYTKIITYVTALGAGVPAVLRIFSFVGGSKSTQKTA